MGRKRGILLLLLGFLLLGEKVPAQTVTEFNETGRLAMLGRVWGFLKYHHPQPEQTFVSWDEVLVKSIPMARQAGNAEEFSEIVRGLIDDAGGDSFDDFPLLLPGSFTFDPFFDWIRDQSYFTKTTQYLLYRIMANLQAPSSLTTQDSIGMIQASREEYYKENLYPDEAHRLLCLFRFWNIIQYFFPYRKLMDRPWDETLPDMIPRFMEAENELDYALAVRELTARIDDSHAVLYSPILDQQFWGLYYPPFRSRTVEDRIVITELLDTGIDVIRVGDMICEVDGDSVDEIRARIFKYLRGSNPAVKERELNAYFCRGKSRAMSLLIERGGTKKAVDLQRIDQDEYQLLVQESEKGPVSRILAGNIGYVHMGRLAQNMVDSVMDGLMSTRAIIFDVRNYPQGTMYQIARRLNRQITPFAALTIPMENHPGYFSGEDDYMYCGPSSVNENYYRGKVVLLFDERTQSHAEFTCMALQTAPDATGVGSQTAGADGNVVLLPLPGGMYAYFTGLGVYYPDYRETQRIGIVPDISIRPTIRGIGEGIDEVLERAVAFIEQN